jgi:hypothetical protein
MSTYSLDTDTITKLLKKHPGNQPVIDRFRRERESTLRHLSRGLLRNAAWALV